MTIKLPIYKRYKVEAENANLVQNQTKACSTSRESYSLRVILWIYVATFASVTVFAYFLCRNHLMGSTATELEPVVSCYYNTPSSVTTRQLLPRDIHPHLCTHINVAFARVVNKTIYLEEHQYHTLRDIVKLKKANPNLKILLSIGGSGNDRGFSEMVVDHASRKIFIRSIRDLLKEYSLDGVDLDWEFPSIHKSNLTKKHAIGKRERQHFSQLLREIRMEYWREKRNYLLTVAVAAPQIIVDAAYDVDQLQLYTDFVNVMTYDFHFYSDITPFTGLNAPLYALPEEQLYLATLNINYTVFLYMSKGLSGDKIVVGVPTYGHTYTLVNANNHHITSPASGFGSLGSLGFVNYPNVCLFIKEHKNDTIVNHVAHADVPYLYRNKEWVSFDYPQSVSSKAAYIKRMGLRGAMLYSLNADDYEGVCEGSLGANTKFPLSQTVKNALMGLTKERETESVPIPTTSRVI